MFEPEELSRRIAEVFAPDGVLAEKLPGYEMRQGQNRMAEAIGRTLDGGGLAVEAGTGIGKTLAYLLPAVLSGQKVVVSTGTLNLQDQILNKEVPFIRDHIDPGLSVMCVKGRQNYLCLYRYHQFVSDPQAKLYGSDSDVAGIGEWLDETDTGDRAELSWLPDQSPLWNSISSSTAKCLGMHCPESSACFVNRLRRKAARADVLIVNHHLFFSDLSLRRSGFAEVLPRYESVIFDEAHHLEDVATRYFGVSFSQYQLLDFIQDIEKAAHEYLGKKDQGPLIQLARALGAQGEVFSALFPKERGRFPLTEFIEKCPSWKADLELLMERFRGLSAKLEILEVNGEIWSGMLRRSEELLDKLRTVAEEYRSTYVYWYERRERTISLSASPIEVAPLLAENFFNRVRSSVFTSATLTTGGNFKYFTDRLGLPPETETMALTTPYDWAGRTMLYIPPDSFPEPASPEFLPRTVEEVHELIEAAEGRTLLLFTSISAMHKTYEYLAGSLNYPLLRQGDAPRAALLESFRNQTHSVLLAVASFWEGVDVPGETLSCVIIDKLPFEVPSDPVIMARVNRIREEGGNPFMDFQVPRAILSLRQGLGRLLRSSADKGVLAVFDVRLFTKRYGRLFMKSMPPSPVTRDREKVKKFFQEEVL